MVRMRRRTRAVAPPLRDTLIIIIPQSANNPNEHHPILIIHSHLLLPLLLLQPNKTLIHPPHRFLPPQSIYNLKSLHERAAINIMDDDENDSPSLSCNFFPYGTVSPSKREREREREVNTTCTECGSPRTQDILKLNSKSYRQILMT